MKVIITKIMKVHARLRGATALDNDDDHINNLKVKEGDGKRAGTEGRQKSDGERKQEIEQSNKGGQSIIIKILKFVAFWL